jgi:hypothetical protein
MFQQQSCMVRNGIVVRAEYVGIVAKCHNPCPWNIQMKKVSKPKTSILRCPSPERISSKTVNCNDAGFPSAYKLCYKTSALAYSTSGLFPPSCNTVSPRSVIVLCCRLNKFQRVCSRSGNCLLAWSETSMRLLPTTSKKHSQGSFLAFAFGYDQKREWTIHNRQVIAEGIGLKAGQAVRNS